MLTIIEVKLAGGPESSVRYDHVPLAAWFLASAQRHRDRAQEQSGKPDRSFRYRVASALHDLASRVAAIAPQQFAGSDNEHGLLALLYSALAVEAGANELAANIIPTETLTAFYACRGEYKPPHGVSKPVWKWLRLLQLRAPDVDVRDRPLADLQTLFTTRNHLVHYKLGSSTAARTIYDRPSPRVDGGMFIVWSASDAPVRVEPSFVERELSPAAAVTHVAAAEAIFEAWHAAARIK